PRKRKRATKKGPLLSYWSDHQGFSREGGGEEEGTDNEDAPHFDYLESLVSEGHPIPVGEPAAPETPLPEGSPEPFLVTRTPHMTLSSERALRPGQQVDVTVFSDTARAAAEEESEDIRVTLPPGQRQFLVDVWLATSLHFQILGE